MPFGCGYRMFEKLAEGVIGLGEAVTLKRAFLPGVVLSDQGELSQVGSQNEFVSPPILIDLVGGNCVFQVFLAPLTSTTPRSGPAATASSALEKNPISGFMRPGSA